MITSTLSILVLLIGFFMFIKKYQRKKFSHLREKEALQIRFRQELLQTQLEIREQTLKYVSQEIHDNIGQTLTLAKLNLNTISIQNTYQTNEKINTAKELVSKVIKDLRTLSKTMNTDTILSYGLQEAIEQELALIDNTNVFQTEFKISGCPVRLDSQKELILFRIVQEATNNIIKHSQATLLEVHMAFCEKALRLFVTDNGCGFDKTINNTPAGSGLRNMQSRAELIGGSFKIETGSDLGTQITITVPITTI